MIVGHIAYHMRLKGMMWTEIAKNLRCSPNGALSAAKKYAQQNHLPCLSNPEPKKGKTAKLLRKTKSDRTVKKKITRKDVVRWDQMHCGQGIRSPEIALIEGVDVEVVRRELQAYRIKMWGGE